MSQSDSDHITSISADDSAINFSDNFYVPCDNDIPPCSNRMPSRNPEAILLTAWRGRADALSAYYAGNTKDQKVGIHTEVHGNLSVGLYDEYIENSKAETADDLSVQIQYLLSNEVRKFYRSGSITDLLLKVLAQVDALARGGQLQMRAAVSNAVSNAGSDDDSDLWGNLDLVMVNMLAGLGVLGGLVDRYHATGKDIDSEAVTWLASKLNDDLDQISDSIDPLRPPLHRVEGVN